jgi:uncharacterized protein YecT (DUF1311 family)
MKATLLAFFLAAYAMAFHAAAEKQNSIDARLDVCLEKANTTRAMIDCNNVAYSEWDKQLNKTYRELISALSADGQRSLRESQRAWLSFRDLESKNIDSVYSGLDGTMYLPMRAASRTNIVRARAIELLGYQVLLSE